MDQQKVEALGPAERIINALINFSDHMVHNRPGIVTPTRGTTSWTPVIWKQEGDDRVVYRTVKIGKKTTHHRAGVLGDDGKVTHNGKVVGEYRKPGLLKEVASHFYQEAADIWGMDNEFAARWASWAFHQGHRDLKVVLCALMLVQGRKGDPITEDGEVLFYDDDYRDVGEAMCLIRGNNDLSPKLLLRVGDLLELPEVAEINRKLGFGESQRKPARGRYYKVVDKWLRYREENLPLLEGLVKAGYRTTVMELARRVGYKPTSPKFFELLRWRQKQSPDGRRTMAIGAEVAKAESWEGMTETEICELIINSAPSWKRIVGLLTTSDLGMTRAIVAAAVEAGSMSDQDLIIMTPTLEDLGLLKVKSVQSRWKAACAAAENRRAENIARNVKSKEVKEVLEDAAEKATEAAIEAVTKDLRVWCIVDRSASMDGALERAQKYLTKLLAGFPVDRLHVSTFNTVGTEVVIKMAKGAAVRQAFKGVRAAGGTSYRSGVSVLEKKDSNRPKENEDLLILFVGDEQGEHGSDLADYIRRSKVNPVAFGLLRVASTWGNPHDNTVRCAAATLGIPCFNIDEEMFKSDDPYAMTRQLQHLIATTPVSEQRKLQGAPRRGLVEEILETPLLQKPVWA